MTAAPQTIPSKRALDEPFGAAKRKIAKPDAVDASTAPSPPAALVTALHLRSTGFSPLAGSHAPTLSKTAVQNGRLMQVNWKALTLGKHWSLLVFIPPAFTHTLNVPTPLTDAFAARNTKLYLSTTDSEYALLAWSTSVPGAVPPSVSLVSDTNLSLSRTFGVLQDDGMALPSLFLIDPQGVIQHVDSSQRVRVSLLGIDCG